MSNEVVKDLDYYMNLDWTLIEGTDLDFNGQPYHYIEINSSKDYERFDILFDERMLFVNNTTLIGESIEVINVSANKMVYGLFGRLDYYFNNLDAESFKAIASLVSDDELNPEYIIPTPFDTRVRETVAKAVAQAAIDTGVARI